MPDGEHLRTYRFKRRTTFWWLAEKWDDGPVCTWNKDMYALQAHTEYTRLWHKYPHKHACKHQNIHRCIYWARAHTHTLKRFTFLLMLLHTISSAPQIHKAHTLVRFTFLLMMLLLAPRSSSKSLSWTRLDEMIYAWSSIGTHSRP